LSFFLIEIKRLAENIPLGLIMDAIICFLVFGIILKQMYKRDWEFLKNPISKIIFLWIIYNLFQIVNPTTQARMAWFYTIRSMAGVMVMYFITLYAIDSVKMIKQLIKLWLQLSLLGALWGLKQEFIGFTSFEWNWINSDPLFKKLIFIWGRYRVFSFFTGPTVFGLIMSYSSLLCFSLLFGPFKLWKKFILVCLAGFFLLGMLFSGTRAAYAIIPAGVFFYTILTFNKKIIAAGIIAFFLGVILLFVPTNNKHIKRFQSAFKPTQDASYKVRSDNQKMIQPFIQNHPMGGGLGSTGVWGKRFAPNSELANFPPDSYYVRIAVELGWIGLVLFLILMFTIFYMGIKDYNRIKNKELKTYAGAMLTVIFSLTIANFPQEATGQYPTSLIFFIAVAIVNRARYLDNNLS